MLLCSLILCAIVTVLMHKTFPNLGAIETGLIAAGIFFIGMVTVIFAGAP